LQALRGLLEVVRVDLRVFRPLGRELVLGEARVHRAGLDAGVAVDALVRVDEQLLDRVVVGLVRRRVDAVDGANLDARVVLLADARLGDHVAHTGSLLEVVVGVARQAPGGPCEERPSILEIWDGGRPPSLGGGYGGQATGGGPMLLLTGATGSIGSRLLPLLVERGEDVRCLVRDPRKLGARRVDVQIALGDLGDLADPHTLRQSLRGVDTVVHLAATIRDQPPRRIEELNGLATVRLLQAAERAGVRRFVFFSALDAGAAQRTRFFRAKWVAERAVETSPLETCVFAPSIVYDHSDPWITLLRRFSF